MAAMTSGAPSRSCTSAGCTSAATKRPVGSVRMWRLGLFIFFAASGLGGLDRLAVDDARRGAGLPSGHFARLQQQLEIDPIQHAGVAPSIEIMLHRRIRRELAGQLAPLAAGPHHIEQRIDNTAHLSLRRAAQPVALW